VILASIPFITAATSNILFMSAVHIWENRRSHEPIWPFSMMGLPVLWLHLYQY
jgi:hypothetical protein